MSTGRQPTAADIAAALALAARAPSVHNTQPWQWRVTSTDLELFADRTRRLQRTDPHGRLLMLSCGAGLHHLAVAMGARGWRAQVRRFPDPRQPSRLADVTFSEGQPSEDLRAWAEAIETRRSDRRPMSSWEVPPGHLRRLADLGAQHGVTVSPLTPHQQAQWTELAEHAAHRMTLPDYRAELYEWTHRGNASRDGIPADNRVSVDEVDGGATRRFAPGNVPLAPRADDPPTSVPLLLTSTSDDAVARLRAGEALSAILLEATRLGLATAIDSQVLEVPATREQVEQDLLGGERSPQVLVAVGWPSVADPLPQTPRRPVDDIVSKTVPDARALGAHD